MNLSRFTEFGRKIVGVGFNYRQLIAEMRIETTPDPKVFLKAPSAYIRQPSKIQIPAWAPSVWYEVELGVVIGSTMKNVPVNRAQEYIGGYCTALDLTCKESIMSARNLGLSWAISKSFDTACPVGELIDKSEIPNLSDVTLWLCINGQLRQHGNSADMTWSVPEQLSFISHKMALQPGDLVLTGTPSGMGEIRPGDVIEAGIDGVDSIRFEVDSIWELET